MNRRKFLSLIGLTSAPLAALGASGAERKEVVTYATDGEASFNLASHNGIEVRLVDFVKERDGKYIPRFKLVSSPLESKRDRENRGGFTLNVG